ncbi:MAG: hypothetical protein O7J95_15750, partial [Planctomycetota bacterium]|nr:hypothetical protein [Planctomycetota bacterium]
MHTRRLLRRCPALALAGCLIAINAPRAFGVEFFADDFEAYFNDLEFEDLGDWQIHEVNDPLEIAARWTITNPGGRSHPPTENGTPSGVLPEQFLISDSDWGPGPNAGQVDGQGTGRSHDVWSPSFSVAGDVAWIHMDCSAQLNNNGTVVFDVDVSLDAGKTWTNAFRRVAPSRTVPPLPTPENSSGFFGRLHVDISGIAANQDAVMFRLRQFEPDWDWWIAVDNVLVDDQPPPQGGAVTMLPREDFEGGIPGNWRVESFAAPPNEGVNTWNTQDPCMRSIVRWNNTQFPYLDGRSLNRLEGSFAIIDSDCDPDPAEDEWLITPALDLTEAEAVFLHYKDEIIPSGAIQEVLLSLDGGQSYEVEPIFQYDVNSLFDGGEDSMFAERVFEIPAAAGQSNVAVAFHYQGGGNEWWWAVDDVTVTANGQNLDVRGCGNRGFRAEAFDAAGQSVTLNWRQLPGDEGFRVLLGGTSISGDLAAAVTSFTHQNPAAGSQPVYTLEILVGGAVESECMTPPVNAFSCPSILQCCPDQEAQAVRLVFDPGSNITGYTVLRDGTQVATLPADATEHTDTLPAPGRYIYELRVAGTPDACATLSCPTTITGIALELAGECGGILAQHDFDGDLTSSTSGLDLLPGVASPGIDPLFDFLEMEINGEMAEVLHYDRGTYFQLFTGMFPNGGGEFTNQYTVIMDVMFPAGALAKSGWADLYQTNTSNANDGEWYVRNADRGIGISGNYGGTIEDDTWYRVALSVDLVAGTYTSFIDGVEAQQNTGLGLDGRFSLYTVLNGVMEGILIFSDENDENSEGFVNSVQVRDVALSPGAITAFGRASAAGIPFNPDFSCPTGLTCCVDQTSREVTLQWSSGQNVEGTGWRISRNGLPVRTVPLDTESFVDTAPGTGTFVYTIQLNGGDPALCANLPLTCTVSVVEPGFLFFDDFDCYR